MDYLNSYSYNKTGNFSRKWGILLAPLLVIMLLACDSNDEVSIDVSGDWLIPTHQVFDGGPGVDGIPSIDNPNFAPADQIDFIPDDRMVVGINIDGVIRVYPHQILDHHEIVNDRIGNKQFALNFCPLTGTAMCWNREIAGNVTEFGVSGLLFRNNLIMYDRNTISTWSQMQVRGVGGELSGFDVEKYQVVETNWGTWKELYPDAQVLTRDTGFARNYGGFLYGPGYSTNETILFPVANVDDRLPIKERVHLVVDSQTANEEATVRVYIIERFGDEISLIRDQVGDHEYLIAGSNELDLAAAFKMIPGSGQQREFEPVEDQLPVIMTDDEGNHWDIFGYAVEGPREGERLEPARAYTGYWFAIADFFPGIEIYGGDEE